MGFQEKYFYSEAGIWNLLFGLICFFIAVGLVIFGYSELGGIAAGEQVFFNMTAENFSSTLLAIFLGILLFGIIGGYEIGRYVQTIFNKRRRES